LDLLAQTPLCASRFLFFNMQQTIQTIISDMSCGWHPSLKHIAKAFLLLASLAAIWLAVMLAIRWYDPGFHLLAVSASAMTVATGNGQGLVEKLVV